MEFKKCVLLTFQMIFEKKIMFKHYLHNFIKKKYDMLLNWSIA